MSLREIEIKLTPTQTQVGREVLDDLEYFGTRGRKGVVAVVGTSGIGKSLLVKNLAGQIGQRDGLAILSDTPVTSIQNAEERKHDGSYVITVPANTIDSCVERLSGTGLNIRRRALPGMNQSEAQIYVGNLDLQGELTPDRVIENSFGVPLLANQMGRPHITEDVAVRLGARYLLDNVAYAFKADNLRRAVDKYLQMDPPIKTIEEVKGIARKQSPDRVYDGLHRVIGDQDKAEASGISLASPLFIATKSEEIYDAMLAQKNNPRVDILAPNLNREQMDALGMELDRHSRWFNIRNSPRLKMFEASTRKSYWRIIDEGKEVVWFDEGDKKEKADELAQWCLQSGLSLPGSTGNEAQSFFVHSHDHTSPLVPTRVGWMTESLLQQLKATYVVDNYAYGARYVYHPEDKRIEIINKLD